MGHPVHTYLILKFVFFTACSWKKDVNLASMTNKYSNLLISSVLSIVDSKTRQIWPKLLCRIDTKMQFFEGLRQFLKQFKPLCLHSFKNIHFKKVFCTLFSSKDVKAVHSQKILGFYCTSKKFEQKSLPGKFSA